jgi:hypothetical protein
MSVMAIFCQLTTNPAKALGLDFADQPIENAMTPLDVNLVFYPKPERMKLGIQF